MGRLESIVEIFLQPGELYFGDRHTRIHTLLGSCVSLVCWHPERRVGGMCHFMLPTRPLSSASRLDGRYGDEAIELMLRQSRRHGVAPMELRIHLFGGGDMFPGMDREKHSQVGRKNVEAARQLLQAHGLTSSGDHVAGVGHRSLIFDLWSGQIALRHISPTLDIRQGRRA
ncbi:chemotaxis protein CheD [Pseudomonas sp. B21-056]|jgi:chemotaxis protein CheD|uniref:chemotaxis protein CheD n=1 Tax=Pseudomonas sp. B21-056 TaxID=2895495 RepID=UPI002232AEF1|nr:chemotaxis protein CheD [Pseudomonas sp. B21-056]UZE21512.1 chemotaxis protein CheD [Pseudomonas sp. B21-056]